MMRRITSTLLTVALALAALLLPAPPAHALTSEQLAALKVAIDADPSLSAYPLTTDGYIDLANKLNSETASPEFWVWRSSVAKNEYTQQASVDGTTFNWTGSGFISRSQGERDAWVQIFNSSQTVNPSLVNVRQAFADIFSGNTAPAPANRTHLLAISRKKATRIEQIFAVASAAPPTPSGNLGSTTAVATVTVSSVTPSDVALARSLP